jgi:hypothetical protein
MASKEYRRCLTVALLCSLIPCLVCAEVLTSEPTSRAIKQDKPAAKLEPKKSNIVPSAGEAELTNGIGDVLPSGNHFAYCQLLVLRGLT